MQTCTVSWLFLLAVFTLNHLPENSTKCDREGNSSSHLQLMPIGFSVSELYLDGCGFTGSDQL